MIHLHFCCQNCARNKELLNITCIEKIKEYIDFNLSTCISYRTICNNCKKILEELIKFDIENYYFADLGGLMRIYNLKLIEQYGFFLVNIFMKDTEYYSYNTTIKNWTDIDKKIFFDSVKDESLIIIRPVEDYYDTLDYHNLVLEQIKDKGYEVNFIQTVFSSHYYIVKKPTLTKPAIKYNINIVK